VRTFVERFDQRSDQSLVSLGRERGLEGRNGELRLAHRETQEAERALDASRAWARRESCIELPSRSLEVPALTQELGEVARRAVVKRVEADRVPERIFGRRELTERRERSPQQVPGFGVLVAPGEKLAQCLRGVGGSPLPQGRLDGRERPDLRQAQPSPVPLRLLGGGPSSSSSSPSLSSASFFRR
jgi:hypothetical protein